MYLSSQRFSHHNVKCSFVRSKKISIFVLLMNKLMAQNILSDFIQEHLKDDVRKLALEACKYPEIEMREALRQIAGRQRIEEKVPTWYANKGILLPDHLPLEQCSSEMTARFKASLISGDTLTDLTGGLGIDCFFLAEGFRTVTYVERQEELCQLARHNFAVLGLSHIDVIEGDGVAYLQTMTPCDCIFLDPARRDGQGKKTVALEDCEPDVASIKDLLLEKAPKVMIKLSPMLDITAALRSLGQVEAMYIIAVHNECKELVAVLSRDFSGETAIHCINLLKESPAQAHTFTLSEEHISECHWATSLKSYLYEPNAAVMKAGAFRTLSSLFQLEKLHPNSHLYTSDRYEAAFPGRIFVIKEYCAINKVKQCATLKGLTQANVAVRNFPSSAEELKKRLKLKDGGSEYLFGTTTYDNQKILICTKKKEA